MQTVTSADGTRIAYERPGDGDGPPLVLLHGGSATRRAWDPLRPHLADDYDSLIPDRRGRGDSGDADAYGLDREVADVRALLEKVEAVEGEATLFGHSFGGLVALAAAESLPVDPLVLYEPALLVGEHRGDDLADRMQARLDDAGREAAMKLFFREAAGVPAPERLPVWPEGVHFDLVETVIRENRAVEAYELPETPAVDAPTLVLTGEEGPAHLGDAAATLADRLPAATLAELDGVGHVGPKSAPERVAAAVRSHLQGAASGHGRA